jgi:hypothetical protein
MKDYWETCEDLADKSDHLGHEVAGRKHYSPAMDALVSMTVSNHMGKK